MDLSEFLSYKTFYYFLKDDSCMDLGSYRDITKAEKYFVKGKYTFENFARIAQLVKNGTEHIVMLKTKFGTIVFHKFNDTNYIKEFLAQNSKKAPCAFFGTHRVSESHIIGIASEGKVNRFIYNTEDKHIVEGKRTEFEQKNGYTFNFGEFGDVVKKFDDEKKDRSINESDVYEMAKDFRGFDVLNNDVEILDYKIYKYEPISSKVNNNIIVDINNKLKSLKVPELKIGYIYFKKNKHFCMAILNPLNKEQFLYGSKLFEIENKEEMKKDFYRALNFCKNSDMTEYLNEDIKTMCFLFEAKLRYSEIDLMIDTEFPEDIYMSKVIENSRKVNGKKVTKTMLDIRKYRENDFDKVYEYIIKNILPKKEYKKIFSNKWKMK